MSFLVLYIWCPQTSRLERSLYIWEDFLPWHHWKYFLCLSMIFSLSRPTIRLHVVTGFQNFPHAPFVITNFLKTILLIFTDCSSSSILSSTPVSVLDTIHFVAETFHRGFFIGLLSLLKKFKLFSCLGPASLFHSPLCCLSCLTIVTTVLLCHLH